VCFLGFHFAADELNVRLKKFLAAHQRTRPFALNADGQNLPRLNHSNPALSGVIHAPDIPCDPPRRWPFLRWSLRPMLGEFRRVDVETVAGRVLDVVVEDTRARVNPCPRLRFRLQSKPSLELYRLKVSVNFLPFARFHNSEDC
jgi:hypothetical protein